MSIFEPIDEKTIIFHVQSKAADQLHSRLAPLFSLHNSSSTYIENFKPLPFFCSCTGWFVSDLVGKHFSHVMAHLSLARKSVFRIFDQIGHKPGKFQGSGNPIICRFRPILNSRDRFIFQKMLFYRSEKNAFWPIINVFSNTVS